MRGQRTGYASRPLVSLGNAEPDLVFIAGTGRSGTTWLAELILRASRRRHLFEPFRNDRVELWSNASSRQYLRADDDRPELLQAATKILNGQTRDRWIDGNNSRIVTKGKLIKDIRANLILSWLRAQFGFFPIILLLRHPGAVAASWQRNAWRGSPVNSFLSQQTLVEDHLAPFEDEIRDAVDPLDKILYFWCVENYVPLRQFNSGEILVLLYEDLLTRPEEELRRVAAYIGHSGELGDDGSLDTPSATTAADVRYDSRAHRLGAWAQAFTDDQLERISTIPSRFGLDEFYGEGGVAAESATLREIGPCACPSTYVRNHSSS
jgi:hypothetical protein